MQKVYENIRVTLESADVTLAKLLKEYESALTAKSVSAKASDLTHLLCMQLRSALDRTAYRYWLLKIAPALSEKDRNEAKSRVYFPGRGTEDSLKSTLGGWGWKFVGQDHQALYDYLLAQQPKSKWLTTLFALAVDGKHIDLVPQRRTERRVVNVTKAGGGSVSWGQGETGGFIGFGPGGSIGFGPGGSISFGPGGVSFSGSVSAMGVPINPATQRVVPATGVTEQVEIWVNFEIEGYGVKADQFCKTARNETWRIIQEMTDQFGLS